MSPRSSRRAAPLAMAGPSSDAPPVKGTPHVALNTVVQIAGRAVGAVVGLVQVAILSHYLHSRGFGEYSYVLSVIGIGAIFADLGLNVVTVRRLSEQDAGARAQALGAVLVARAALACLVVIACDGFAFASPLDTPTRNGILLMSALYVATVPASVGSIFQAELELQYPIAVNSLQSLLGLAVTAVLVAAHASLLPLLGGQLVAATLGATATYQVVRTHYRLSIRPRLSAGMRILGEALPVGIGQALVVLYFRIDAVLLGILRGPVDVAHYTAAYRFVDLANFGVGAFMASAFPVMVRVYQGSGPAQLVRIYQALFEIVLIAAIPLTIAWVILARPIIFLVFPADFGPAVTALAILAFTLVPLFLNNLLGTLVLTLHRERTFNWIALGALILNLTLNLIFIPRSGIIAAAVMTVVAEAFVTACAIVVMWKVIRHVPSVRGLVSPAFAGMLMIPAVYALRGYWVAAAVAGALVYAGVTRVLGVWSWHELRRVAQSTWTGS